MRSLLFVLCIFLACRLFSQELYVSTEPASNMPSHSIGFRLNNEIMPPYSNPAQGISNPGYMYRVVPEVMFGINKKWMAHASLLASNFHHTNFSFEGVATYLKYRFLSFDKVQSHFRVAAYGKASFIDNLIQYSDINLQGDNTGLGGGIIMTQLLHKLAISFTGGYVRALNNLNNALTSANPTEAYNYSLSAGYLLLPFKYKNYQQPNLNLYAEVLGKNIPSTGENYLDIIPAIQFIIKSRARLDLGYRKQISGNMRRINTQGFVIKFEYNIFSAY